MILCWVIIKAGGIENAYIDYNTYFPFPTPLITQPVKLFANRLIVKVHKHKMGIVTDTTYTVKVYPNQSNIIQINW